jgi:hypothetical protein
LFIPMLAALMLKEVFRIVIPDSTLCKETRLGDDDKSA